jgi:hypothetical protein
MRAPATGAAEANPFKNIEAMAAWKEQQDCSNVLDCPTHGGLFMRGQIIHDDDIAGFQSRHQDLFNVGEEQLAVDCTVEYAGGDQTIRGQGSNESRSLPVTLRRGVDQPGAALGAPARADHVGLGPGLVDENQSS